MGCKPNNVECRSYNFLDQRYILFEELEQSTTRQSFQTDCIGRQYVICRIPPRRNPVTWRLLGSSLIKANLPLVSPEVAKKFVITHLDSEDVSSTSDGSEKLTPSQRRSDLNELDQCIEVLGGRLTDLEFFARRLKTGQTPNRAVAEIIDQR